MTKTKGDRDETFDNLKKISEKVVPPLIEQVITRDKEIIRLLEEVRSLKESLKMVHAVVRSPKLSDMYSKEEMKLKKKKRIVQERDEAFRNLRSSNVGETTAQDFIRGLSDSINMTLYPRGWTKLKTRTMENTRKNSISPMN